MICTSCGRENRDEARFCDECAANLAPQEEQDATPLSIDFAPPEIGGIFPLKILSTPVDITTTSII